MQIVQLALSHLNFYCPATGEQIMGADTATNLDVQSMVAYWEEGFLKSPDVKDKALAEDWKAYYLNYKMEHEGEEPEGEELLHFLRNYDGPHWVVFELTPWIIDSFGNSRKMWFVLNLDANTDE